MSEHTQARLLEYHRDICEWIMTLDVGSGTIRNPWVASGTISLEHRIFICGNLARVLMIGHELSGETRYLDEAMRWAESFRKQQRPARTADGEAVGYWFDNGARTGNIYFGDTGTATSAMALLYPYAPDTVKTLHAETLERYAGFVTRGSEQNPQGWLISDGPDRGALGCGYNEGRLCLAPYTISTGTTGGGFFAQLYAITGKGEYLDLARNAASWLCSIRGEDGRFPYIVDGATTSEYPLDTITYVAEGLIATHARSADDELREFLVRETRATVDWLLREQNPDGTWGELHSFDQQRSPGVVTFLNWHYHHGEPDPAVADAIARYCDHLLVDENSEAYGVRIGPIITGFVGLAVGEIIEPGVAFGLHRR